MSSLVSPESKSRQIEAVLRGFALFMQRQISPHFDEALSSAEEVNHLRVSSPELIQEDLWAKFVL